MNWTIIGCGWLGTSLAEALLKNGDAVIGTTTRSEKQLSLEQKGIKSTIFNLNSQISTEIIDFSEIVVLSIPPFNKENPTDYANALVHLVRQFNSSSRFIFLSSTGVYPQKDGTYSEAYIFKTDEQNNSLFQAEKNLSGTLNNRLTILRLGGLFGDDRHPIYHLSGKENIKNPLGKINFAGKMDIVDIIQEVISQAKFGEIFNVVFPEHPKREEYYVLKAKSLNLVSPKFSSSPSIHREISSQKTQKMLGFEFKQRI